MGDVAQLADWPGLAWAGLGWAGLGWAGLQNGIRPSVSVWTVALTAFCLFIPEMNFSRSLRPTAGPRTRISVPSMIPGLPAGPEAVDDLGERPQAKAWEDGAAPLGQ
ncbi:hypothetical protein [Streptomyces sp. NPDC088748]|uniref:hypothetical protein n=1 Tax=Streptomyces sp. NPDC088748 TaxID=3365887 RepID=UPI0037FC38BB